MPAFVVPARSGAHRIAAIALYRALLTQCSPAATPSLPLADDQRAALRNVIRNKFRRNRHVHSTRHLKLSFTAGYELLDALDQASSATTTTNADNANANATASATALLTDLLATAPAHLTRSPDAPRGGGPTRLSPSPEACLPRAARVLATRPRPASALGGTGVRRVPRLVSANLFPMLRLGRPQPRSLSRVLTDKIKQRQRRLDLRKEAQDYRAVLARGEDVWDRLVAVAREEGEGEEEGGEDEGGVEEGEEASWEDEPARMARIISAQLGAQKRETEALVERMQGIVDKEEALAGVEREARKKRREVARMGKKRAEDVEKISGKKGGGGGGGGRGAVGRRTGRKPV
ncbi:hypothetical protein SLS58_005443 [Diplodia intermedia]|uniref:Complex 1 LYR protein domain-containing protein n=1 Tax=Diplodia intermedia TaxID=856260 RepID=A0ABR3TR80_9PEZI